MLFIPFPFTGLLCSLPTWNTILLNVSYSNNCLPDKCCNTNLRSTHAQWHSFWNWTAPLCQLLYTFVFPAFPCFEAAFLSIFTVLGVLSTLSSEEDSSSDELEDSFYEMHRGNFYFISNQEFFHIFFSNKSFHQAHNILFSGTVTTTWWHLILQYTGPCRHYCSQYDYEFWDKRMNTMRFGSCSSVHIQ